MKTKYGALSPLATLQQAAHENAKDKGWHDEDRTVGDEIALMHSELSEALEAFRSGTGEPEDWFHVIVNHAEACPFKNDPLFCECEDKKPEGIAVEIADVVIRAMDFAGAHGFDLGSVVARKMLYNETRPHRHGGKRL